MDFDQGRVFFSDQGDGAQGDDHSPSAVRVKYREFLRSFRLDERYVYRGALREAIVTRDFLLDVDVDHLMRYDDGLANDLFERPAFHLPLFEQAAIDAAVSMSIFDEVEEEHDPIQITLSSSRNPITIRQLLSTKVTKVVTIPGIIISASRVKAKATSVFAQCRGCQDVKQMPVRAGFAGVSLPRKCDRPRQPNEAQCPLDPYMILPEKCKYIDQQQWKLQEPPEMVPTGEMPRSVLCSVDRRLVDAAIPGNRVTITGIMAVMTHQNKGADTKVALRTPYLQVLGIHHGFEQRSSEGDSLTTFSEEEAEAFVELSRDPTIFERVCKSIAPAIFGSADVKKAIACLLFGGARKELLDGARLRGDINVLLLGDPSVAKSQFLKFVERAAPIAVYTSGKGSSAAGLTATVTQDSATREFYLEGGAMVLADGGVVCIDEFDKMREQDRVAIHEAMEQQTISIAKAGITTVLNSRTSVLAAANPTFGRYDDTKNAAEQVDFQSTILSRFDMIFVLRDLYDREKDLTLAAHVIDIHMQGGSAAPREPPEDELEVRKLKRYVAYARAKCHPRLTEAAAEELENHYVRIRANLHAVDQEAEASGRAPRAVPITVRQLEAIIRISESLAKMRLSPTATEQDVHVAIELFRVSTLQAALMGDIELEGGTGDAERKCEQYFAENVPIRSAVGRSKLVNDAVAKGVGDSRACNRALNALVSRGEFGERHGGKTVFRNM